MNSDCLFCSLAKNTKNFIFETSKLFVILDRFPSSNCHLLIIPKTHHQTLDSTSDSILSSMITVAKDLACKLKMKEYNLIQNNGFGQLIKHIHFHLVEADFSGNYKSESKNISDEEYENMVIKVKSRIL